MNLLDAILKVILGFFLIFPIVDMCVTFWEREIRKSIDVRRRNNG